MKSVDVHDVIVLGAGASGLMASYVCAQNGLDVIVLEKNAKAGRKLAITGKGRCNVTNVADREQFFKNVITNPRFLYSSLSHLNADSLMELIQSWGVPLKVERGGRVFPQSDNAFDIVDAFYRHAKQAGALFFFNETVVRLSHRENIYEVYTASSHSYRARVVLLALGGASYPLTGSCGDGYRLLKELGHTVHQPRAALSALRTRESWPQELMGLSLKNVRLTAYLDQKELYCELGEMLFTHFGISGPLVLSASSYFQEALSRKRETDPAADFHPSQTTVSVDLKPALSHEQLTDRLQREFSEAGKSSLSTVMNELMPHSLAAIFPHLCGIDPMTKCASITRAEREKLCHTMKNLSLSILEAMPLDEAIVTHGGVSVAEVDPKDLSSKICPDLYIVGELLNVDALTGGFNLQIAFSTAYTAAQAISRKIHTV